MENNSGKDSLVLTNLLDYPEVCGLCREPVKPDSLFCDKCGAKLFRQRNLFESPPCVLIKNWEIRHNCLDGMVYGHPKFKDGTSVITSEIKSMKYDSLGNPKSAVTRSGTLYLLGAKYE